MLGGFHLGAALLLLLPLLLLAILVPRRWRREAERKEKVRRLMLLAAAEEDRAEREALVVYSLPASPNDAAVAPRAAAVAVVAKAPPPPTPPPPPTSLECASCSRPATGRCARCKAVRYCSGKCQIIHWRQGHKDECYKRSANVEYAVEFDDPGLKNEEPKQSSLDGNNAAPETLLSVKADESLLEGSTVSSSPDALVKDNSPSDEASRDVSWKEMDSDTVINASVREGSNLSHFVTDPDASANVEPLVPDDDGSGEPSASISYDSGDITVDTTGDKSTVVPIPVVGTRVSEENELPPSHLKPKASLPDTQTVECLSGPANIASSMSVENKHQQYEAGAESLISDHAASKIQGPIGDISLDFEVKISSGCTVLENTSQMERSEKLVLDTTNSHPVATRSMNDTLLQNKKISRSSSASGSNQLSSNDGCPTASHKDSQVANVSIRSTSSMDSSGPIGGDISSDFEVKMSSGCTVLENTSQMERTEKLVLDTTNSHPVATRSMNDTLLQNKKISRSSSASGSNQLSSNDGCPTASHKDSQVANVSIRSTSSMDSSGPIGGDISLDFEVKMSSGCTVLENTSQMERTEKLVLDTTNSHPVATRSMNDKLLQNKKISRSSSASGSNQLSSNDGCPTASHKDSQVANVSIQSTSSMDSSGPIGLPTSANGIVTQLPISKISRNYSSEMMLFSYDLFIKLYNDKVEFRPCGLINSGNSCYANVVLQSLFFTRPLMTYFFEGLHSGMCSKKEWCFTCELERLFMNSKQGKSPLSTMGILSHLEDIGNGFGRGKQEDAHEFLRHAVDAMQSVCLKETGAKRGEPLAEETTLIQQTYGGYLRSKIICCRCKGKSEQCERMMDLAVEIDGNIDNIEEALKRFTSMETLDGENKYKCNRCKSYEQAEKQLKISEAPNVLTIALKRFQSGQFGKLNKVVRFHEFLDLAPYMCKTDDKTPIYRLYAVVVHIDIMNASSSGHYVCYVKDTQEKWYEIDDSKVKPVEFRKVLARNAYILFYARCLPRAPSLIRNAMAYELMKINRKWKPKPQHSPSVAASQDHLHRRNANDPANSPPFLFYDGDSDSSSLFSCSDECSWSTDSTRESTTSDESFDASNSPLRSSPDLDGMTGSRLSWRCSSDTVDTGLVSNSSRASDSFFSTSCSGPESGRKKYITSNDTPEASFESKGSRPVLYPDKGKGFRHLTENYRSTETDWINTSEAESGVVLRRRSSRERTAQTFY